MLRKKPGFAGEAVAAVIGTATAMACFDETGFPVTWEERQAVSQVAQALMTTAPQLHADHPQNVMCGGLLWRVVTHKAG